MHVGDIRIDPVIDGTGRFSPTKSFRGTTEEQWAVHRDLLDEDGLLVAITERRSRADIDKLVDVLGAAVAAERQAVTA